MYNNIVPPSKLPPKADYFLFRVSLQTPSSWTAAARALTRFETSLGTQTGRYHPSLGGRGEQGWWQMVRPDAKEQDRVSNRQDVVVHRTFGSRPSSSPARCPDHSSTSPPFFPPSCQMLAAIGETFDVDAPASETELITGIILSSRPAL
jgi:hypothetical protein